MQMEIMGGQNTFDSDNGGTALTDPDTDGDNLQDRIDIDADDDGIVDVIEAQVSSSKSDTSIRKQTQMATMILIWI